MLNKSALITLAACIALAAIIAPPVSRTVHLASSADGLLFLAGLSDDEFSLNPWSEDCYLIRQDTAVALLNKFNWPYRNRSTIYSDSELPPLIYQAVRARGSDDEADDRLMELIGVFAKRGHSINERWDGYLPVHLAILFGDAELVAYLIENEADLHATIDNPGRAHHGLDSFEFAELLLKERPEDYERIAETLNAARGD